MSLFITDWIFALKADLQNGTHLLWNETASTKSCTSLRPLIKKILDYCRTCYTDVKKEEVSVKRRQAGTRRHFADPGYE